MPGLQPIEEWGLCLAHKGTCNRDLLEDCLETCLIPQLNSSDVIVPDNASFHKSVAIEQLVAEAECEP